MGMLLSGQLGWLATLLALLTVVTGPASLARGEVRPDRLDAMLTIDSIREIELDDLHDVRAAVFDLPPSIREETSELAESRRIELQALWREALSTMMYAAQLASIQGGSVSITAFAALMHRAGRALATGALAVAEVEQNTQLDPPSTADWLSRSGDSMFESLARSWKLPEQVVGIVRTWQQYGEPAEHPQESSAVYFGHVLAMELLHPEWSLPAAIDAAAAELHLNAETLEWVRGERPAIVRLLEAAG